MDLGELVVSSGNVYTIEAFTNDQALCKNVVTNQEHLINVADLRPVEESRAVQWHPVFE